METKTFAELGLSPKVQAAIEAAGYSTPTPIQQAAIPVAVTGRDVLGIAQTGTGKTASFVLPMIARLETGRARARMPRSLILAPTRELAAQVAQSFEKYGVNHKLNVALLIGGVSMDDQVRKLDRGVDVLIATPGRMLDHFQRGRLMLMGVEILVIDEADRMLDMGFIPDIEKICKLLPPRRQTLFFSATMPPEITRLVSQFLRDPERIEVARPATTANTITQRFRFTADGEDWVKRELLRDMISTGNVKNAIIFCNRKRDVAILLKSLQKHGFNAGGLHGDMDQSARTETLDKFRNGEISLLAASDVAARGLDIPDVSHVFNFDLPWQPDDYVHRIGRTGRAGREGTAHSIVTPDDLKSFKDIEKMLGVDAEWIGEPPSQDDFADAGKRKRGRGGRGGRPGAPREGGRSEGGRGEGRGGEGRGESRGASGRGDRGRRDGSADRGRDRQPEKRASASAEAEPIRDNGSGEQPQIEAAPARQPREERPAPKRSEGRRSEPRRERTAPAADVKPEVAADVPRAPDSPRAAPDSPRGAQRGDNRPAAQTSRPARPARPAGGGDAADSKSAVSAFAGNVPAFMRRPPRAVKAANE
ncbi:DEAD/DEAH box helicase [Hyphomicrobium sp.]|uniref:DEAD/DEAH box helicase n=1 Tax=Hyphomicrobium sp. TaxID=82 RepID=UPI003F730807